MRFCLALLMEVGDTNKNSTTTASGFWASFVAVEHDGRCSDPQSRGISGARQASKRTGLMANGRAGKAGFKNL